MRLATRLFLVGLLGFAGVSSASAQNLQQIFEGIGRLGQPRTAATQAEWERMPPGEIACIDSRLRRRRRSINTLIDNGIGPTDNRVAGIVSACRADAGIAGSPAQVTARDNAAFVVNGIKLGDKVSVGSADYLDYACAPSQQYAGFTGCQRQTAERSRRRHISESTAFLHAADGTAVYVNQSLDPVVMDDDDAHDEITRLSESYGPPNLLPMQDARGVPSGLIASWGAVSLLPLPPERRAAVAAGTDDKPGILVDSLGNLQRSAQLGLPIYQLGGGAGYVWSATWNGRGRGTLRIVALDASRLPGAVADAKQPEPAAPVALAAASAAPTPEPPKPVMAAPQPAAPAPSPAPAVAEPTSTKPAEPAAAPANVRVVGPPIALRATPAAPAPSSSGGGNGLVTFLIVLVVVLVGAVAYLFRKLRIGSGVAGSPVANATVAIAAPEPEKIDLPALVPVESPDSIATSTPEIEEPKTTEEMTPISGEVQKRISP
ncbi:hypothetical protein BH11PSE4_BH11PSE4_38380 [soil metagenome]